MARRYYGPRGEYRGKSIGTTSYAARGVVGFIEWFIVWSFVLCWPFVFIHDQGVALAVAVPYWLLLGGGMVLRVKERIGKRNG